MTEKKSHLMRPDFTEDLVAVMIQMLLTIRMFPFEPFALVPLSKKDEVKIGADVVIEAVAPIYIQFKRSFAYPENSSSGIIRDRKKLNAGVPKMTLFFDLRNKQPGHSEYQHNVLFDLKAKLEKTNQGIAFYTAPLFLNRSEYLSAVHLSSILSWSPWWWFVDIPFPHHDTSIITEHGTIRFHNVPCLNKHVVIPPHAKVKDHKHRYSYSQTGTEVCFHDPTALGDMPNLGRAIYDFLKFEQGVPRVSMTSLSESGALLENLSEGLLVRNQINGNAGMIERWIDFGERLRADFDIYQFMLLRLDPNSRLEL